MYAVPTGGQTIITNVQVCNQTAASKTFRISAAQAAAAADAKQYAFYDDTLQANESKAIKLGWTLGSTDVLRAKVGTANSLSFNVFGVYDSTNETSSLLTSLIGYWKLDEVSGDCTDSTGITGTATNSGTVSSQTGILGNSREFTANTQYLTTPLTDLSYSAGTINWWQYNNVAWNNNTNVCGIMGQGSLPELSFQKYLNGNLYFGWNRSGDDDRCIIAASSSNWPQSTWVMYTFTWTSGGNSELFCNGSSIKVNSGGTTVSNIGTAFRFGVQAGTANTLNGRLDSIGIWNRVLTSTEITTLYNSGAGLEYPF